MFNSDTFLQQHVRARKKSLRQWKLFDEWIVLLIPFERALETDHQVEEGVDDDGEHDNDDDHDDSEHDNDGEHDW